ncbi:cyanate lyase [Tranquillimonas rosea]|uniref:Cyanate hydratase n=1 Tax=Tranquillimonas rosea TaxID=641238 RepID=A0A1H9QYN4_9RHOB|nr:cyanase [Tranquillimonas rosea]SER64919.1 cyanate lyase [Tranquillimonas rosea]
MKDLKFTEDLSRDDVTLMALSAKKKSGLTWEDIAKEVGMSPVWTHAAATGMAGMPQDKAETLVRVLDLPAEAVDVLTECPSKDWSRDIPTDPCIYRLYEIAGVYGPSFKALVHEKFGDGIMSAIDFDMEVTRVEDPKGDRVKVEMTGKFLPYKQW